MRQIVCASVAIILAGWIAPALADITISSDATQDMSCSAGVCQPTATDAVLNVNDLENYIYQNGNVQVTTTGSAVQAGGIVVDTALTWSKASLTLNAQTSIVVNAPVSVGARSSELELIVADGTGPGFLSFGPKGQVTFASLSDVFGINGGVFTLVNSVKGLASAVSANPNGSFALARNYFAEKDGTYTGPPVRSEFTGIFEGLGNSISNLSVTAPKKYETNAALFSSLGAGGTIENLRLLKISFQDLGSAFAGLVGYNVGTMFGDDVSGSIAASFCCDKHFFAGGVAGGNSGSIIASFADVQISAPKSGQKTVFVGGLVGDSDGSISLSHATGDISGATAGGLVGVNGGSLSSTGTIDQSWSSGTVSGGNAADAGGLVGNNYDDGEGAIISNSYSTASVKTGGGCYRGLCASAGGLVGINFRGSEQELTSYSTGHVQGRQSSDVGGFAGYGDANMTDDYWDTTTSGTNDGVGGGNVSGVTGLTTKQLRSGLPTGFDPGIWAEKRSINNGLPYLIANPPPQK